MAYDAESGAGPGGARHIVLWVAQALLAVAFGSAGLLKLSMPMPQLIEMLVWPSALPPELVRTIGAVELIGAAGLIIPAATRIVPWLTPIAALGLSVIMALAIVFHIAREEWAALPINLIFIAMAGFIVWGRSVRAPIPARR
ncbi:MAG TPA: DoxX family protein [Gemmatimonadaceae bacterium]|nr:DoxX family protein [Gemmatimonadaceae bacterium]